MPSGGGSRRRFKRRPWKNLKSKESMWVKTIPGKGWWSAFRIYGPQEPAFDGTWKLNDIVEVKY